MNRYLTHRFWVAGAAGFGGLFLALLLRSLEPAAAAVPFLGLIMLSVADGWWRPVEAAEPAVSQPRVVEGDTFTFTIELRSAEPVPWVELEIQFPAMLEPLGPSRFVVAVDGVRRFTIPVRALRWGAAGPEWAVVTTRDRFGVSELVNRYPLHVPVRVHPPSERLTSLLPVRHQRPVTGDHQSRRIGSGSELAEVRPYRQGDPLRMVHPLLTNRRGTPMVIDRHPDQSGDVVLLIDSAQDLGVDLDTTLRWTITAATALADRQLRAQDRVGLLDVGRGVRWVPARLGRRHLHSVVDALLSTEVLPRDTRDHRFVTPANLPSSAAIVAISPLLSELILTSLVNLRSVGHEVLVIKPSYDYHRDPSVSDLARRIFRVGNALNEKWLIDRGVVVVPWSTDDSLEHLMRRVVRTRTGTRMRR